MSAEDRDYLGEGMDVERLKDSLCRTFITFGLVSGAITEEEWCDFFGFPAAGGIGPQKAVQLLKAECRAFFDKRVPRTQRADGDGYFNRFSGAMER